LSTDVNECRELLPSPNSIFVLMENLNNLTFRKSGEPSESGIRFDSSSTSGTTPPVYRNQTITMTENPFDKINSELSDVFSL
jgi:hypothetical protein